MMTQLGPPWSHVTRHQRSKDRPASLATRPRSSKPEPSFALLRVDEVLALPEPTWLVEGIVPAHALGQLYGQPGHMKSFVALDLAVSVATGRDWMGHPVKQGPVVYVAAEGLSGFRRRIKASMELNGLARADLADFRLVGGAVQLGDDEEVSYFLREVSGAFRGKPSLIVFDTQARCTLGIEENSNSEMGRVVAALNRMQRLYGATVMTVHHSGRSSTEDRGASSVKGALDFQIRQRMLTKSRVEITSTKQKDWEPFQTFRIDFQPIAGSLVPVQAGHAIASAQSAIDALTDNERSALMTLRDHPEGLRSGDWMTDTGLAKSSFHKARKNLLDQGLVTLFDGAYTAADDGKDDPPTPTAEVHGSTPPLGGGPVDPDATEETGLSARIEAAWEESHLGVDDVSE